VAVLLALVNVALYFQRRLDWRGGTTGQLDTAPADPSAEDD
jgi:ACR3 family arsenite transporter